MMMTNTMMMIMIYDARYMMYGVDGADDDGDGGADGDA